MDLVHHHLSFEVCPERRGVEGYAEKSPLADCFASLLKNLGEDTANAASISRERHASSCLWCIPVVRVAKDIAIVVVILDLPVLFPSAK